MDFPAIVFYAIQLVFYFLIVVPSAIIHEYAHGWMADRLGDPTARYAGRLTLNPRAHIDKWGTLLMPVLLLLFTRGQFLFAYAKPVPYNPYNLKDQKWGPAWVGLAGPMANFLLAAAFAVVFVFMPIEHSLHQTLPQMFISYNFLDVYNYVSQFGFSALLSLMLLIVIHLNILLMVFNLVPIPPLDGSKILFALLPDSAYRVRNFLERYGFVLMLFFVFFLFELIAPIINILFTFLVG